MKRLVWIDKDGVRAFGCAGCRWAFAVKEFTPDFPETKLRQEFFSHDCRDPLWRMEGNPEGSQAAELYANADQVLRDLCGLQGMVLASIESLPASAPTEQELAAVKTELDRVRSLLWLRMQTAPSTDQSAPSTPGEAHQRRWQRYDLDLPVTLVVKGKTKIQARGTDLNEGGMTVHAPAELEVGEELKMEFRPPFANTMVQLTGMVRNRNGKRYGIEFLGESGTELQEIALLRTFVKMLEARVSYYRERIVNKLVE